MPPEAKRAWQEERTSNSEACMHVLFVGEPDNGFNCSAHNAGALADLGAEAQFDSNDGWRSRAWKATCARTDAIHLVTYCQQNWVQLRKLWRARMAGVSIVRYWVGSDCLWAAHHEPSRRFALALDHLGVVNLAVAEHLVDELGRIGVRAEYTPIITPHISALAKPHPLPSQFTVLCYLPTIKREFYGGPVLDRLMEEMPDVHFIVLCDEGTDYHDRPNVESLGYVEDLERTIGRSTVHVRPTMHDGMPRLMLEMLSQGRHAVACQPYPHCVQAADYESTKEALSEMKSKADFNLAGREFVCGHFETRRTARILFDRFEKECSPGRLSLAKQGKWQAARLLSRCPWMLSRMDEDLPLPEALPEEAIALRTVLRGYQRTCPHMFAREASQR